MKGKTVIAALLVGAVALLGALSYGQAASAPAASTVKIGLVSVRGVFNASKKHALYEAQTTRRLAQAKAEMDDLARQLDKEETELKTTLKPGTADYVKQYQVMLELRSKLQNQQEMLKQQRMAEDKKWFESLYQETLKATEAVAKEKGLDLVLERTETKFPTPSEEVLGSAISTTKVLYGGGCPDVTAEVTARVDASATLNP